MFFRWMRNLFLFIEDKGSYDNYVPLGFPRYSMLTNRSFIQRIRIMLWTEIAKKYEPFAPFYCREKRRKILESLSNQHVKDYYEQ